MEFLIEKDAVALEPDAAVARLSSAASDLASAAFFAGDDGPRRYRSLAGGLCARTG